MKKKLGYLETKVFFLYAFRHMLSAIDLKRPARAIDLSLAAAKKRISPRTRMVHLSYADPQAADTIPIYENMCFVLALCLQKKAESVLEAKDLLQRLLPFQGPKGNFPVYLHEYPNCHDSLLGLKIAPVVYRLLRDFGSILGSELRDALRTSLNAILSFYDAQRPSKPIWDYRFEMMRALLLGSTLPMPSFDPASLNASELWEFWISLQFLEVPRLNGFDCNLFAYCGLQKDDLQRGFEPNPLFVEWMAADALGSYSDRLLVDDPRQIQLAALEKIEFGTQKCSHPFRLMMKQEDSPFAFALLWGASPLHSLCLLRKKLIVETVQFDPLELILAFPPEVDLGREDLFETVFYCDASDDVSLSIDGRIGTVFHLNEQVSIQTPKLSFSLSFELISGEGEFCGHLLYGNRPSQVEDTTFAAYDWKIALRTLRRSADCKLRVRISTQ